MEQTRVAAEKGDPAAEHNLAMAYLGQADYSTAFEWFQKAADQGDPDSYWQLARLVNEGKPKTAMSRSPVRKDLDEALRCVLIAANLGHETAQLDLARRYEGGNGFNRDIVESYKWYKLLAQKASLIRDAQYMNRLVLAMNHEEIQEGERRAKDWKPHQTTNEELLKVVYLQKIVLKGFVESSGRRMAIINGYPLQKAAQANIKVGQKTIPIRCVELKDKSAIILIEGITQPQEVSLR